MKHFFSIIIILIFNFGILNFPNCNLTIFNCSIYAFDLGIINVNEKNDESFFNKQSKLVPIETIKIKDLNYKNISEIIQSIPGINIRQYGSSEDYTTISVRGSNSNQTQILFDGIPLNSVSGLSVNLSDIPAEILEQLEIYKSISPAEFDYQGIGGVLNLKTSDLKKDFVNGSISYGSYNTKKMTLNFNKKLKKWNIFINLVNKNSDGDFKFKDNNNTIYNTSDDTTKRRKNNDFDKKSMLTKINYNFQKNIKMGVTWFFRKNYHGIAGYASNQNKDADLLVKDNLIKYVLNYKNKFLNFSDYTFSYTFKKENNKYYNIEENFGIGKFDTDDNYYKNMYKFMYKNIFGNFINNFILSFNKERFMPFNEYPANYNMNSSERKILKMKISNEYICLEEKLKIMVSSLYNKYKTISEEKVSDDIFRMQTAVNYKISENIFVKATYGKYFRLPSFYELFGQQGYTKGNSSLLPEKSRNYDLTLNSRFKINKIKLSFSAAYFNKKVENLIKWLVNAQGIGYPINFSKAEIKGLEFSYNMNTNFFVYNKGSMTYLDTSNKDKRFYNNELPNQPKYEISEEIGFIYKNQKIYFLYQYLDEAFLYENNKGVVDEKNIINIGCNLKYKKYKFDFELKNITEEVSNDVYGYPLPGRSYVAKLSYETNF